MSIPFEAARQILRDRVRPLPSETVALTAALARVSSREVLAPSDVPPFAKAAVDGYAVRAEDTFGAGPFDPVELRVTFEVFPGKLPSRPLARGEAARIMTGAPVPEGTDAVVMLEHVEQRADAIRLVQAVPPRKHVAMRGEDVTAGSAVVPAGRRLRPEDLGVLASIRAREVAVVRRPRVAIYSTGNEVQDPLAEAPLREGAIFDANGYVLEAMAVREGAIARRGGILRDDRATIRSTLADSDADVTITSGSASKGTEDFVPVLVRELGQLWVQGVAIRPAHPLAFGRIGERLHFALPGNPVAAWVGFRYFVAPAVRMLSGITADEAFRPERTTRAALATKIGSVIGRTDFIRVRLLEDGRVEPVHGGAGVLTSVSKASGIVVVPRELEGLEAGSEVEVELL